MKNCKTAALAASIALALGTTAAFAAAPAATQLPGQGKVASGAVTNVGAITGGLQTITLGDNTVIDWGATSGASINTGATAQPGGFNIGSGAALTFTGGTYGVLNVDVSGNPSQIMGGLSGAGNVYVANSNGIIVGATAQISSAGKVGLIANNLGTVAFDGTNSATSMEYEGSGGDVTVTKGATIDGANVLVSGGGVVNVDLSAFTSGNARLYAGVKNSNSTLVNDNPGAVLTTTGDMGGATLAGFQSAGDASTAGAALVLPGAASGGNGTRVDGTLTNTGTLTLTAGFNIAGALVNNKTLTQAGSAEADGGVTNAGAWDGGNSSLIAGGVTNNAQMTNMGYVESDGGDFVNNGQFTSNDYEIYTYGGGSVTNSGVVSGVWSVGIYEGGDFTNTGKMTAQYVYVLNGSITNGGQLATQSLDTASDDTELGFTAGADYSITNTGTVTSTVGLTLGANSTWWSDHNGTSANDSTGSVSNTGVLQLGAGQQLNLYAHDDATLAGTVQVWNGTKYAATSASNPLDGLVVYGGDWDGSVLNTAGVATLATDLVSNGGADIYGNQVKLLSNLSSVDGTGTPTSTITVVAGAQQATDYAVRVASGKTITANAIFIEGDQPGDAPNVILQGTLAGHAIEFGDTNPVSDVFSGPNGGIVAMDGVGPYSGPYVDANFTGRMKAAPYLNDANFRYNYLPITNASATGQTLYLTLTPAAYTTNGTSNGLSAVNVLVNGDVLLAEPYYFNHPPMPTVISGNGSAVTGVADVPNTHLVLQSTGNIQVGGTWSGNDFYWPGYVYLGNISTDADGNALPGTLGMGAITTEGSFSNVLPGDVAGASGIHFITQFPLTLGGDVTTNANAWVNFGTQLLTDAYASGTLAGNFFGGTQGSGTVVNYGPLDSASFHFQAPNPTK